MPRFDKIEPVNIEPKAVRKAIKKVYKRPGGGVGRWSEDQRISAIAEYLILGNIPDTARKTKIPIQTLRNWKQTDFWKETAEELQRESNQKIQGKLSGIIDKGLQGIDDRLTHGDSVYNSKTGKIIQTPIKAAIVNQITKDAIDKKILLEKVNKAEKQTEEGINDRLDNLKREFLKFVSAKTITETKEVITNELVGRPERKSEILVEEMVPETKGPDTKENSVIKHYRLKAEGGIFGITTSGKE